MFWSNERKKISYNKISALIQSINNEAKEFDIQISPYFREQLYNLEEKRIQLTMIAFK